MNIKHTICYDDVLLVPQYSNIQSRKEIDISNSLSDIEFSMPIISAPMDTVTGAVMTKTLDNKGGLGIVHRYNTIEQQVKMIKHAHRMHGAKNVAAAIGVTGDYIDRAMALHEAGVKILCIDVAHGHHTMMRHSLEVLRNTIGTTAHINRGYIKKVPPNYADGVTSNREFGSCSASNEDRRSQRLCLQVYHFV